MVKHIVCFLLKDKSEESCKKAQEVLLSMKDHVEILRDIQVGVDFLHSDRSCDVVLEVVVDDREALEAYQNRPYHVTVVKKHMHAVRESSVSADYEF